MNTRRDPQLPNISPIWLAAVGLPATLLLVVVTLILSQSAPNWADTSTPQQQWEEQINVTVSDREDPLGVSVDISDSLDGSFIDSAFGYGPKYSTSADRRRVEVVTEDAKGVVRVQYEGSPVYVDDAEEHYGLAEVDYDPDKNSCFYRTTEGTLGTSLCAMVPMSTDSPVVHAVKEAALEHSEHLEEWDPDLWPVDGFEYLRIEDLEDEPAESTPAQ